MTDSFSWDYVTRTAREALIEAGRVAAATIVEAVEPGIYPVAPGSIYEVRSDDDLTASLLLNGRLIFGSGATPDDATLVAVASELGAGPQPVLTSTVRSTTIAMVAYDLTTN